MDKNCIYCGNKFRGPRAANICPFCSYEAIKESKKPTIADLIMEPPRLWGQNAKKKK